MVRSFDFTIKEQFAPLAITLPSHTSIYNEWPRKDLRASLPNYLSIATTVDSHHHTMESFSGEDDTKIIDPPTSVPVLMGMPIHVVENDVLEMNIMNNLSNTGLSIHFHGFEMKNALEYDGVVGLTQCAIPPLGGFHYTFEVEETEGSYWYHTHSGNLGVNSHNMIKAPLIVHPNTNDSRELVDELNSITARKQCSQENDYGPLLSYANERIVFISDGFLQSDTIIEMYSVGGLNPPVQLNDEGFVAASMEYQFGSTINGKMREVIHVVKGGVYKFRFLNGGTHFGFRISIDSIPMTITAADSHPVVPYEVDEIILHTAERFDVEVKISESWESGDVFWIRADTLESRKHGYQNGVRAILHVVDNMAEVIDLRDDDIMDPTDNITEASTPVEHRNTMNCYSNVEREEAAKNGIGACLPITALTSSFAPNNQQENETRRTKSVTARDAQAVSDTGERGGAVVRTVDFDFNKAPLHAWFVRIENENWYQHTLRNNLHLLRPSFNPSRELHPHTAVMNVPTNSPVIIIWRNKIPMDQ